MKKLTASVAAILTTATIWMGYLQDEGRMVTEIYTVQDGDTIWSIAENYLPKGKYILEFKHEILEENPEVKANGCVIHPGDKLKISYRVK